MSLGCVPSISCKKKFWGGHAFSLTQNSWNAPGEDDCGEVGGVDGSEECESCSGGGHEDGGRVE